MKHRRILIWGTLVVVAVAAAKRRRSRWSVGEQPGERWTLWGAPWTP